MGAGPIHHCQTPPVPGIRHWWPKSSLSQPPAPGSSHCFLIYLSYQIFVLLSEAKSQAVRVVKGYMEVPQKNFLGSCRCLKSLGKQESGALEMCVWKTSPASSGLQAGHPLQAHGDTSPGFPEELSWITRNPAVLPADTMIFSA